MLLALTYNLVDSSLISGEESGGFSASAGSLEGELAYYDNTVCIMPSMSLGLLLACSDGDASTYEVGPWWLEIMPCMNNCICFNISAY